MVKISNLLSKESTNTSGEYILVTNGTTSSGRILVSTIKQNIIFNAIKNNFKIKNPDKKFRRIWEPKYSIRNEQRYSLSWDCGDGRLVVADYFNFGAENVFQASFIDAYNAYKDFHCFDDNGTSVDMKSCWEYNGISELYMKKYFSSYNSIDNNQNSLLSNNFFNGTYEITGFISGGNSLTSLRKGIVGHNTSPGGFFNIENIVDTTGGSNSTNTYDISYVYSFGSTGVTSFFQDISMFNKVNKIFEFSNSGPGEAIIFAGRTCRFDLILEVRKVG